MKLSCSLTIFALMLVANVSFPEQWWEEKPFTEWSSLDLANILFDSPWVTRTAAGIQQRMWQEQKPNDRPRELGDEELARRESSQERSLDPKLDWSQLPDTGLRWQTYAVYYQIRLLTAKPIRQAMLRRLSLTTDIISTPSPDNTVSIQDIQKENTDGKEKTRLQRFIKTNPTDVRVSGNLQYIVLSITMSAFAQANIQKQDSVQGDYDSIPERPAPLVSYGDSGWREDVFPAQFSNIKLADFQKQTFISIGKKNRLYAVQYDPPKSDYLGAKFYFPRFFPDGTPLITAEDKELKFETKIGGKKIKAKFDLRKLRFKGTLEI